MKRKHLLICALFSLFQLLTSNIAWTQTAPPSHEDTSQYLTQQNILYRTSKQEKQTPYMLERCRLDVYYPKTQKNVPTIVWFHGGGLTGGERFIPEELKNKHVAVVAVGYRLSPKVQAPAYLEDAAAVAWVYKNMNTFGGDPNQVYLAGHSAGAYLCLMLGLDQQWLEKHQLDANALAGIIAFSAQTITHFSIRKEHNIPEKQPWVDAYAPLYHVRADAAPLLLITGDRELELLGRYEENAYLMRMMRVQGHQRTTLYELDGLDHGEILKPSYELLLKTVRANTPKHD